MFRCREDNNVLVHDAKLFSHSRASTSLPLKSDRTAYNRSGNSGMQQQTEAKTWKDVDLTILRRNPESKAKRNKTKQNNATKQMRR
jgi:hypothetical protein